MTIEPTSGAPAPAMPAGKRREPFLYRALHALPPLIGAGQYVDLRTLAYPDNGAMAWVVPTDTTGRKVPHTAPICVPLWRFADAFAPVSRPEGAPDLLTPERVARSFAAWTEAEQAARAARGRPPITGDEDSPIARAWAEHARRHGAPATAALAA